MHIHVSIFPQILGVGGETEPREAEAICPRSGWLVLERGLVSRPQTPAWVSQALEPQQVLGTASPLPKGRILSQWFISGGPGCHS